MKRLLKIFIITVLALFILLQFYPRAEKNISREANFHINTVHAVPTQVAEILKKSCYDCHSNHTDYPWYSSLQPLSYWLDDHIAEGKKELNFSEFARYNLARQYRKLEEINGEVKENNMPLQSYTFIHRGAKLSPFEKSLLSAWVESLRDSMEKNYPADSLIRKKK